MRKYKRKTSSPTSSPTSPIQSWTRTDPGIQHWNGGGIKFYFFLIIKLHDCKLCLLLFIFLHFLIKLCVDLLKGRKFLNILLINYLAWFQGLGLGSKFICISSPSGFGATSLQRLLDIQRQDENDWKPHENYVFRGTKEEPNSTEQEEGSENAER